MKSKILCAVLVGVTIFLGSAFGFKYADVNKFGLKYADANKEDIEVNFSEVNYDETTLMEKSDAIVVGKITEFKNKKTEKVSAKKSGDADIIWTYSVYTLDVSETISGNVPKRVNIVFAGNIPKDIELNKESVFFLEKDMIGGDSYHLTSYIDGVFTIQGDIVENKKTNMKFEKELLKEKVKSLKK